MLPVDFRIEDIDVVWSPYDAHGWTERFYVNILPARPQDPKTDCHADFFSWELLEGDISLSCDKESADQHIVATLLRSNTDPTSGFQLSLKGWTRNDAILSVPAFSAPDWECGALGETSFYRYCKRHAPPEGDVVRTGKPFPYREGEQSPTTPPLLAGPITE
ncbi:MAG: hypothetical protein M1833_000789 [Piccolia ochrophora]|nr:MAG: hypothetical protein M1833_000789 [Piccolia ochrophora]